VYTIDWDDAGIAWTSHATGKSGFKNEISFRYFTALFS
jgi:hypothetical protein